MKDYLVPRLKLQAFLEEFKKKYKMEDADIAGLLNAEYKKRKTRSYEDGKRDALGSYSQKD